MTLVKADAFENVVGLAAVGMAVAAQYSSCVVRRHEFDWGAGDGAVHQRGVRGRWRMTVTQEPMQECACMCILMYVRK